MSKAKSQVGTQELVKRKLYLIVQRRKMFTTILDVALINANNTTINNMRRVNNYSQASSDLSPATLMRF